MKYTFVTITLGILLILVYGVKGADDNQSFSVDYMGVALGGTALDA